MQRMHFHSALIRHFLVPRSDARGLFSYLSRDTDLEVATTAGGGGGGYGGGGGGGWAGGGGSGGGNPFGSRPY